jgi:hypothetical protein
MKILRNALDRSGPSQDNPRSMAPHVLQPDARLAKWQAQLVQAQAELATIGPMRPGSLSLQYKDPAAKKGPYWQLSYTHNMRSRSRYVRPEEVPAIKPMLANFKRFRLLVDRCVDLSVRIADRQAELRRAAPESSA